MLKLWGMTFALDSSKDFVFRPRSARTLAGVLMAASLAGAVAVLATGGWRSWSAVLPLVLVGYAAWLLFWFPKVVVGDDAVTLVNPLQTLAVPWASIILVDTKYALTLVTPSGRHTAWAAPAPGATASLREMKRTAKAEKRDSSGTRYKSIRPGDQHSSDSGVVAAVVRQRLERLAEDGRIDVDATNSAKPARSLHVLHVGVLLLLLVLTFTLPALAG